MKTPIFIKARVCTRIDDETICTTREKKVVLAVVEDTRGRLLDGREVVKIDNWWYYIPPRSIEYPSLDHDNREPRLPQPPHPPVVEQDEKVKTSGKIKLE